MNEVEIIVNNNAQNITKRVELPDYGEVRITSHGGKITFIETTTKEKVE